MPKINDKRIRRGKQNRDEEIRKYFENRFNAGIRYEIIEEEIILKWGLSSSAIYRIIKSQND